jgi:two-component system sensor histidine kinase PilS (NtrC family)
VQRADCRQDGPQTVEISLKRSIGWLTAARIVVLLLILLSAVLVQAGSGIQFDPARGDFPLGPELSFLYLLNGAAVLLALFHWTIGRRLPMRLAAYVQLLGDLAIVTVLVYGSGGPDSVFNFLYLVVIGLAAFLLYRTGAVLVASIAAVLYGSVVQLLAYGILPPPPLAPTSDWGGARVRYNLAITVAGFYGVAFMAAYLSEKLRSARDELVLRQKALQRLQNLYGNVIATMSSGLMTTDAQQRVTFLNRAGGQRARCFGSSASCLPTAGSRSGRGPGARRPTATRSRSRGAMIGVSSAFRSES